MQRFKELLFCNSNRARIDTLCSMVVFPRTESLANDTPQSSMEVDGNIEYDKLQQNVHTNPTLISLGARDDVTLMLKVLSEVHDTLHLEQFDNIQICRGGVILLRIVNTTRSTGRSACIEFNEYHRRLHQGPYSDQAIVPSIVMSVLAVVGVTLISYYVTKK